MDLLFFENWYRYQDEVICNKKGIDIIQAMCVGLLCSSIRLDPWSLWLTTDDNRRPLMLEDHI